MTGESCRAGRQYWDDLLKKCIGCNTVCRLPHVITRCTSYCELAYCKALPGHYYDGLLKKCVRCAAVCGRHPAECSEHCQTPPPPVTTKKFLIEVTSHVPNSRGVSVPTALEDSILLYSLLGLCMVLLFSSLSLALAVLVRRARAKTTKPRPKESNHHQESVVQPGQEVGQSRKTSKDFLTNSNGSTDCEPPYDCSPTETCVCVHCFPDLKVLGQGNERPLRAPFSFYQQAVLHKAQIQKGGGPVWTEENLHTPGLEVQEEAAVG